VASIPARTRFRGPSGSSAADDRQAVRSVGDETSAHGFVDGGWTQPERLPNLVEGPCEKPLPVLHGHPRAPTSAPPGVRENPVLGGLRCEPARRYLAEGGKGVDEVAFAFGFSDGSAFRKAFKRWTGEAPRTASCIRSGPRHVADDAGSD